MSPSKEHFYLNRKAREHFHLTDPDFLSMPPSGPEAMKHSERQASLINDFIAKEQGKAAKPILPAQFNGMKLLHEIFHHVIAHAAKRRNPEFLEKAWGLFGAEKGEEGGRKTLTRFLTAFPTQRIWCGFETPSDWSAAATNRNEALEESILVWLNGNNPALDPFGALIDDQRIMEDEDWKKLVMAIQAAMRSMGPIGPNSEDLADLLTEPIRHAPNSILEQLRYIRLHWQELVEDSLWWDQLDRAIDYIEDEDKYLFFERVAREGEKRHGGAWFEKEAHVPSYGLDDGPANYSADSGWMPEVVMLAKSTYVWLDQLSKQYQRPVYRLQDIPDEELDRIAGQGFTALWLIGLWQRSQASQKIKQMQGNPEAKASAYALEDYDISWEIGGYEGYENLRERTRQRGIRLASDMVPNHTGMDSRLVREKPEWFLATTEPPYWNYSYTGPNLSSEGDYGIWLEDGYWNRSDAAVTFKRTDFRSGDTRYIYHGNDGTNMPWNDTAQLNFLSPEVREGVIQQILHVARMFPIIRFDAAMVLAKRHIQRLWFPLPGHTAAVPSRSAHAMSMADFDRAIPEEFWREVVDRVQREVPDTLLLAEAFWMLEGYFVRTLGMHRVYNSAFMHMLKKEDNASYRYLIKNTLEFDAEILKRYVNFMNNPDEDTAIAQFGNGDKYFGVCMLMITMPGLPMFGHGQVEGFTEKYGMEYAKAYYDEQPDGHLVWRHYQEIFPVIKMRPLFAEVANFYLYDVYGPEGAVNENVFAYSNRRQEKRALMVYNNRYERATGWIRTSVGYLRDGAIRQSSLVDGLELGGNGATHVIFRDHQSGLEFLRSIATLRNEGLHVSLEGFKYNLFLDFREVSPSRLYPWDRLENELGGAGCVSMEEAVLDISLAPLRRIIEEVLEPGNLLRTADKGADAFASLTQSMLEKSAGEWSWLKEAPVPVQADIAVEAARRFERLALLEKALLQHEDGTLREVIGKNDEEHSSMRAFALQWILLDALHALTGPEQNPADLWRLDSILKAVSCEKGAFGLQQENLPQLTACLLAAHGTLGTDPALPVRERIAALEAKGNHRLHQALQLEERHRRRWFRNKPFTALTVLMSLQEVLAGTQKADIAALEQRIEALEMQAYLAGYELGAFLAS